MFDRLAQPGAHQFLCLPSHRDFIAHAGCLETVEAGLLLLLSRHTLSCKHRQCNLNNHNNHL